MVTLIVVTYNSRDHLRGLADSLGAGLEGVPDHRVVVVDNASTDGTPDLAQQLLPAARVVRADRNTGYAAGVNAGCREADDSEPVLVLNPDVRLHRGSVARLLAALQEPGVGVAVPRLVDDAGRTSTSLRHDPTVVTAWAEAVLGGRRAARWRLSEVDADPASYAVDRDVDWATGAVVAMSAACRRAVGAWDESFFLYSEEVDWCRRARAAGFRVRFAHDAVAGHTGGAYGTDPHLWRVLVGNRVRDFARHHSPAATAAFRAGVLLGELLRSPLASSGPSHRAGARAALRPDPVPGPAQDPRPPGFVWFAAQDWWYHNQAHSDFQLMRHVARDRPVLVVNSLGLRVPRRGATTHAGRRVLRKLRSTAKLVRRPIPDLPHFHVMTPLLLPAYGDTRAARLNAWLVRQQVRAAARLVGVGDSPHLGVTIPTAWPVVRPMQRSSLVFNRADLHSAFPEADGTWVAGLEAALLRESDAVLYVSRELQSLDAEVSGDRAVFLDHGVDLDHFTPDGEVHPDVAALPTPRLGFFGGLDDYVVDMELLRRTAEENPDCSLVLVGDATCPMDELTALPNVYWLGHRPYASIPALGRGFDVALMPWLDNEWIRFANPIKLKEYLALGLPVVTTAYPEVDAYRDRVLVADERDKFPVLVRQALSDRPSRQALRESVRSASWQARAAHLCDVADQTGAR